MTWNVRRRSLKLKPLIVFAAFGAWLAGSTGCAGLGLRGGDVSSLSMVSSRVNAPMAPVIPTELKTHDDLRVDNYYWLRNRDDQKVIDYLKAENEFTQEVLKPTLGLQETLFEEMKNRIKPDDSTVPEKDGEYFYYTRFEAGREYPIRCRKKGSLLAPEEIILDANELTQGDGFLHVGAIATSPNGRFLAYAVDRTGGRVYTIHFKDLSSGKTLTEKITDATADIAWATDNQTLFYTKPNSTTLRSEWIYRHRLGSGKDTLVFHEKDETFDVGIELSLSKRFLFINSTSTMSTEVRYLRADQPSEEPQIFFSRMRGHEYDVEDGGDRFYIRTNDKAKNFRLMETPYERTDKKFWKEVVPHRADALLEGFIVFRTHLALEEKKGGLARLQVIDRRSKAAVALSFKDPVYMASLMHPREFDADYLRFEYESMTTPESVLEYRFKTGEQVQLKQMEVLGGFRSEDYESQRLFATAPDGTLVPISLVYRKDLVKSAKTPLLLEGYGAYGLSEDPVFQRSIISLLDRGFIFAMAHVRGGSEMGRAWYEDGRLLKKKNSFTDFIACTEFLHKEDFSSPAHTYATGGSAGGLLMGAVLNLRPDLYNGVVAEVPFVDIVTTMLDTSIPLTTSEFDEWGNPADKTSYDYMKSYSPYDNVEAKDYTNLLVTAGLNDSQVPYWEPAKWVAKLRKMKTDKKMLLLHTNMETGHSGKSGRFQKLKDIALNYAFLLELERIRR